MIFLFLFVLIGCNEDTYNLVLPDYVSASVAKIDGISGDTEITLTLDLPSNLILKRFLVNDVAVELVNNRYTFVITSNTIIVVETTDISSENFSLILPVDSGITADVGDLLAIKGGSRVVLDITPPANKIIDTLKVNNVVVEILNNKYTLIIQKDTIIEVTFIDPTKNYRVPTFSEILDLLNNLKPKLFMEGNLSFNINTNSYGEMQKMDGIFIIDDKNDIKEGIMNIVGYDESNNISNKDSIYIDGVRLFILSENYDDLGNVLGEPDKDLAVLSTNNASIEYFVSSNYLLEGLPISPNIINDTLIDYYNMLIADETLSKALLNFLDIRIDGTTYYIDFVLNSQTFEELELIKLLRLLGEDIGQFPEGIEIGLRLVIKDYKLLSLNIDLISTDLQYENIVNFGFAYSDETITKPNDLETYPGYSNTYHTYNMYLTKDELTIITLDAGFIDELYIEDLMKIYKKGYFIEGLYLEQTFDTLITKEDLQNITLNIYIKWDKAKSAEQTAAYLLEDDILYLYNDYKDLKYYENNDYIFIESTLYGNNRVSVYDKLNDILYSAIYSGNIFNSYEVIDKDLSPLSIKDILNAISNNNYLSYANRQFDITNNIYFFNNSVIINDGSTYGTFNNEYTKLDLTNLDVDALFSFSQQ